MCKGIKHKYHLVHAQRKEAQSPEESGPKQVENKPITEANHLTSRQTPMGQVQKITGGHPPKMGLFEPSHGADAPRVCPPASPIGPILRGLPLTDIPKAVAEEWDRFNVPR